MHGIKSNSPKKHSEKIVPQEKISTSAKNEANNLVGMVVKNVKPKISPNLSVKSHDKNGELKFVQKLNIASNQGQLLIKNSVKRKDEKSNRIIQKKVKTEVSIHSSDVPENVTAKKLNKYKSAYPKTYICKFCCRRFYTVEQLKQHSVNHGSKPNHVCYLCNHQTASFSALMTHYLKHSSTKGDKIEKIYAKSKADFSNIQFNIFSRPKSSYQCSNCKLSFNIKSKYDSHTCSSVIKKNEYNCAYCGHISLSIEEYRTHVQSHSETPFMCSHCKYKVQTKKQLDKHQEQCKKRLDMKNNFKCHKCSVFTCKNKTELILHLKTCHTTDSSYICSNCHSEFQEKKNYDDHLSVCQSAKKVKPCVKKAVKQKKKLKESAEVNEILCDTCGNAFKSKSAFEEHEKQCVTKMANATNEINKNLCDICGNVFKLKSDFEEHKKKCLAKMANATNKVTSSLCSTSGSSIETTKIDGHVETYLNQIEAANEKKLDVAATDNPATRRSTRLVKRKSSFIDDDEEEDTVKKKPIKIKIPRKQKRLLSPTFRKGRQSKNPNNSFLCSYCDFTFCSKSTLLRHKRMHSGNPWYICQYCGKFFFRKDVYIRHEMNVHSKGSKTIFCCYYCKLCFEESPPLKEHVLEIHKDSAFLPTKHRRPRKKNMQTTKKSDLREEEEIKKSEINYNDLDEIIETVIASANNVPETLPPYKCSVCSQTFEKASDIEIHMFTHPDTLKREKCDEILNISSPQNLELSPNANESDLKVSSEIFESAEPCSKSTFVPDSTKYAVLSDHNNADVLDNNVESNSVINEFSNLDNLVPTPNLSTSNISESLACKLCLKEFSNKKLLEAHSKTLHRLVDWYQCLACSACGPKQEMQEHMFMHMFKVGTFVVNSNSRNFDNIISCLQLENGQKKINENTTDFTQDAILRNETSSEITNLIHEDELPPLREFGICSCIEGSLKPNQEQDKIYPEEETTLENESNMVEEVKDSQEKLNSDNEMNMSSNESELQTTISCSVDNFTAVSVGDICSKKSEDIFEVKDSLKIDETNSCEISFSNQGKEEQSSSFQSEESGSDENEGGKFSQLRYLLQKPSALKSSENKITLYPFSQTQTPGFTYESSSPLVKYSCSMEDSNILPLNLVNPSLNLVNTIPDRQSDVDLSNKNNHVTNLTNFKAHLSPDTSQSISTCLKFDINQSRSEFSENVTTSSQNLKSENCELDKTENIFKSCPSQSTILDFSDLIQHSFENSSPSEDNLFAYSTPVKQVDVQSNINNREGVRTPDCTDMANYDCSAFSNSVKCKDCNVLFEDYEQMNHQCFASKSDANSLYVCKSKNIFPSLNYPDIPNQNKISCIDSTTDRKLNILSPQKSSETFASSCVAASTTSEMELERHPSSEYVQNVLNPILNNSKCTKCHRTFRNIGELMKHSLTCLKSLFFKTALTNDSAASSGCLQTLLTNRTIQDSKSSFDFSLNSPLSFNTVSAELSQSSENLLNHSFDS